MDKRTSERTKTIVEEWAKHDIKVVAWESVTGNAVAIFATPEDAFLARIKGLHSNYVGSMWLKYN